MGDLLRFAAAGAFAAVIAACRDSSGPGTVKAVGFTSVSAGARHTCGVSTGGEVYCWGDAGPGNSGQSSTAPLPVSGGLPFSSVSAGAGYACGLAAGGALFCWGFNYWGLGNGSSGASALVAVAGDHVFVAVSAGVGYTCGLATGGTAYCWGENDWGQLGTGSTAVSALPGGVQGGPSFTAVSAGFMHSCGIASAGSAYCWGRNLERQLGTGSTDMTPHPTPVAVSGSLVFASVSAGPYYSCGVTSAGAAYCWGRNLEGQLGTGSLDANPQPTPKAVSGGLLFTSLSVGGAFTCGVTRTGAAYCWGTNAYGQLGDGSTSDSPAPVAVSGGLVFASVSAGGQHTCGLTTAGVVYCWGSNDGQLGDGTRSNRSTPVRVAGQP
jgi:alpha-tubulin suppressor-like RCC1 family protein